MTRNRRGLTAPGYIVAAVLVVTVFAAATLPAARAGARDLADRYSGGAATDPIDRIDNKFHFPWESPNIQWQVSNAAAQSLDEAKIDALQADLAGRGTKALLIVRNGKIVREWYAPESGVNRKLTIAGATKGVVAAIALQLAINDGLIGIDDPAWHYIPQWEHDPVRSQITIRHLMTHSSGIENVLWGRGKELNAWEQKFSDDGEARFLMAIEEAPLGFAPGSSYNYSSVGYYALSYALATAMLDAEDTNVQSLLNNRIMEPLEIPRLAWAMSYGTLYEVNGLELNATAGGGSYTARALAKVGQLMLNEGRWNGKQLIPAELVKEMTSYGGSPQTRVMADTEPASGLGWQTNYDGFFPSLPRDAFLTTGANHELLLVIPSLDIVVVRQGTPLTTPSTYPTVDYWLEFDRYVFSPLMAAVSHVALSDTGN